MYAERISPLPDNEIGDLGRTLNSMSSRLTDVIENLREERDKLELVISSIGEGIIAVDQSWHVAVSYTHLDVYKRQIHYILVKCAQGPVYQRDVEGALSMSRSTATGILQLMEKNGLIQRKNVESDARLKSLIPTEKAIRLDAEVGECLRRTERHLTEGLSNAQLAAFMETAALMSANLDK